ncbi:hypothetical protein OPQ81_004114 [Rhizoctonia solani]|nr:hypothetical protein OPQ81_004114 [Rhizoctonia solani]
MTPSTLNASKGRNNTQPIFKPPSGGDLTLRSSDGVDFLVHSTYLKLGSSVFANMIATGTTKDTIELTESAVDVSYLLRFIYPNRLPVTISLDELPSCLLVAQKYDVEGALDIIDELIAMDGSPHKPISSDPVRAYQLAVRFGLSKTKLATAPLVTTDRVNFCDLTKLPELSRAYPSLKLIRMMNLQSMRSKVLYDVLFDFKSQPMLPTQNNFFYDLCCGNCWSGARYNQSTTTEGQKKSPTTWSLAWARLAYETLLVSQIDRSQFLFQATVLQKFIKDDYVCQECLSCIKERPLESRFESWVGGVKNHLEIQLERLELLYAI